MVHCTDKDCEGGRVIEEMGRMQCKIADRLMILNEAYELEKDVSDVLKACVGWLVGTSYKDYLDSRSFLKNAIEDRRKSRSGISSA